MKIFVSYKELRYEQERLDTFIKWPLDWLKPEDLARDGFYFLREKDYCACVFCDGIIGDWEDGDTPRGEHQRLAPQCHFIRGDPVGNIPLEQCTILSKLSRPVATVCGCSGGPKRPDYILYERRLTSFERLEETTGQKPQAWPEETTGQKPQALAEAGFYYCGKP